MIAIDTNILVYAHRAETPRHEEAKRCVRELAEGREPWALPVFCLWEFIRVVTHARLFDPPTPCADAIGSLDSLVQSPTACVLSPGVRFWELLSEICTAGSIRGNLVYDAQIAAVLLEHGVHDILTEDGDFRRFAGLRVVPLTADGPDRSR